MTFQTFTSSEAGRRRYWARSLVGWPTVARARPNAAHAALAAWQAAGRLSALVTQNVDGLHSRAGADPVIDLHGRIDRVRCLSCGAGGARADYQARLLGANPHWGSRTAELAPDGDADIDETDFSTFTVPPCEVCGGIVKPDVVFFGENVPRDRVERASQALERSDGMLVVGSSLTVFSGFRFAREAARMGLPIVSLTLGVGRADDLLAARIALPCDEALAALGQIPAARAA